MPPLASKLRVSLPMIPLKIAPLRSAEISPHPHRPRIELLNRGRRDNTNKGREQRTPQTKKREKKERVR
jgi:hypothetical protein